MRRPSVRERRPERAHLSDALLASGVGLLLSAMAAAAMLLRFFPVFNLIYAAAALIFALALLALWLFRLCPALSRAAQTRFFVRFSLSFSAGAVLLPVALLGLPVPHAGPLPAILLCLGIFFLSALFVLTIFALTILMRLKKKKRPS